AEKVPEICRNGLMEWAHHATAFGEKSIELMCERLGVRPGKLKEMRCTESVILIGHYYLYCPQRDLTAGLVPHTDHTILTVLLQDQIGGLQVKLENQWVSVVPVHGAITVNVGDLFQLRRNSSYGPLPEFLSVENPPHYRGFTLKELWKQSQGKPISPNILINAFKIVLFPLFC
ncbi:hypothetical protein MKX01_011631, partial [Papaver californicum]